MPGFHDFILTPSNLSLVILNPTEGREKKIPTTYSTEERRKKKKPISCNPPQNVGIGKDLRGIAGEKTLLRPMQKNKK